MTENGREARADGLESLLPVADKGLASGPDSRDAAIDLVILSKDRACQLDGLLRSVRTFLRVPHRSHVIYKTSSQEFERGYDLLRRWHLGVHWVDDGGSFRVTFLDLLAAIAAGPGRFFVPLVDDMLFTRPFTAMPLIEQLEVDDELLAISLRLGDNIHYCYTQNRPTRPPDFRTGYRWAWKTASRGYWNYPMSVDGNVYRTSELAGYVPKLRFDEAGTLEAHMAGRPLNRPLLACEPMPCVINLAMNRVQSSYRNRHGDVTAESLNRALLAGFAFDVRPFVGKVFSSCHIEAEITLIPDRRPHQAPQVETVHAPWKPARTEGVEQSADGEQLILHANGADEQLALSPSAQAIWQLCDGTRTVEQIQQALLRLYHADGNEIGRDLVAMLERLLRHGLVGTSPQELSAREIVRIDLREIPCFVINCKEDVEKKHLMEEQLSARRFPYEIVPGYRVQPPSIGIALAHLKVLRLERARVPFLVLEDDCEFNDRFQPILEIPAEADAVYLGVSVFGLKEPGQVSWGRHGAVQWVPYSSGYLRVLNMLARHAVLYMSADYQQKVIDSQIEALTNRSFIHPGDIGCALLHASHIVLTPDEPVCLQRTKPAATERSLPQIR